MKIKFSVVLMAVLIACSMILCGCGKKANTGPQVIDKNKTQIYISVYDGGAGTDWIVNEAVKFNEGLEDYQIYIRQEKRPSSQIIQDISASAGTASAYFTVDVSFQELIYADKLVDLTPILNRTLEGENRKIGDKLRTSDSWEGLATKNGEGMYLLPYNDSVGGLIFDFDDFVKNDWLFYAEDDADTLAALNEQNIIYENNEGKLFYVSGGEDVWFEEGDRIMSAGKDKLFGTYDDGQPQNIAEWNTMISKIKATNGSYPFLYPGSFLGYTSMVESAYFAQLAGVEAYKEYFAFDSKGRAVELTDGTSKVITIDNGYDFFKMKEINDTIQFMQTYFTSDNVHPSTKDNTTHLDAQRQYLNAPVSQGEIPYAAMICEGIWWENEARTTFNLVGEMDESRGYGMRDYRFMLLPYIEGQKGITGNAYGSVLSGQDTGSLIVVKENDTKKTEVLLDFLAQTLSDECLANFTAQTGVIRAYDYNISDEQFAGMTKFAQNVWRIYKDTENIEIVRPFQERSKEPIAFAVDSGLNGTLFPFTERGVMYSADTSIVALYDRDKTASEILDMVQNCISISNWNNYISELREQGFYL